MPRLPRSQERQWLGTIPAVNVMLPNLDTVGPDATIQVAVEAAFEPIRLPAVVELPGAKASGSRMPGPGVPEREKTAPRQAQGRLAASLLLLETMTNGDSLQPLTTAARLRTPEARLLAAVLKDAMDVYRHPRTVRRALLRATEAWFRSDDRRQLSFVRICETLGLDPVAIRTALAQDRLIHQLAA